MAAVNSRTQASGAVILAVDDSPEGLFALETALTRDPSNSYRVLTASTGGEALHQARVHRPDLILLDINMPDPDGYAVTRELKADPELRYCAIVLLTAKSDLEDVVYGLAQGADDYIKKPYAADELLARVAAALRVRTLYRELHTVTQEKRSLQSRVEERTSYAQIIGKSPLMLRAFDLVEKVKDADVPVLITGESGTGKELIAAALHFQSVRKYKPFVVQNCAALNEQLLESELFGHVRGAFTGALRDKAGLFESAHQGTFFLDEVGEMSPALQAKLLRVLQDGSFTPVGATQAKKVSVRVVAATHRNLTEMVAAGTFRQDLFYRLNVVSIELPPLRDRGEDIPLLVEHFLRLKNEKLAVPKSIQPATMSALMRHRWPGNVRELQSEVERLVLLSGSESVLSTEFLSPAVLRSSGALSSGGVSSGNNAAGKPLKEALAELERRLIVEALESSGGNKSEASRVLGISRSNLIAKVQEYGLEG